VSADIFEVSFLAAVSIFIFGADVSTLEESIGVTVLSLELEPLPLLLQAAKDVAMIAIAKNFFIFGIL
jgi:hypothetical protein